MSTYTTTYQGKYLDLELYSSALDSTHDADLIATFRPKDRVAGQVILHPIASTAGRLSIHVLGTLTFTPTALHPPTPTPEIISHTFLNHSIAISLPPSLDRLSAFARRSSLSADQFFPFDFPLRASGNLPCSFYSSSLTTLAPRNRAFVDSLSISYNVLARWEPDDTTESLPTRFSAFLVPEQSREEEVGETIEALFSVESAGDDQPEPYEWQQIPLITDRPLAFSCATTLPTPTTFSLTSQNPSIPYYVVFTTASHDPAMIREIASDATIAVSLVRVISFTDHPESESGSASRRTSRSVTPIPPPSPTPSLHYGTIPHARLHHSNTNASAKITARRAAKNLTLPTPTAGADSPRLGEKLAPPDHPANANLPTPPPSPTPSRNQIPAQEEYAESRTLSTSFSAGFPKRPKHAEGGGEGKPEGLFKGSLMLSENWVPSLECAGLAVKYFVDVSVLVDQDEFRARIPVKIV